MKKILLFSNDPGGSNTIIPLLKKFGKKYDLRLYGKNVALARYALFGFKGRDIMKKIKGVSLSEVKKFLGRERPDCVITGSSSDDMTEKFLWRASSDMDIPSFAIVDQWMNYGIRFSKYGTTESDKYDKSPSHDFQPDKIFLMDNYAKNEMEKIGFDSAKLIVTGHPYFDLIDGYYKKNLKKRKINKFKKENGISLSDKLIVFASEPLDMTYGKKGQKEYYWGYTEKTIIKVLLDELKKMVFENKIGLTLVLKPHPRENEDEIVRLVNNESNLNFKVKIYKKCNTWDLIMASDLVCGMSSMFLIESVILGRPVMSIQIGLKRKDHFILSRRGIMKTILKKDQLKRSLENILVFGRMKKYNFNVIKNASDNVVGYINKYLCKN
jgi:hypothetical protein